MQDIRGYDSGEETELTQERDPYSERSVYDAQAEKFKKRQKKKKNEENT